MPLRWLRRCRCPTPAPSPSSAPGGWRRSAPCPSARGFGCIHRAGMLPKGSCHLCYSQRKRGNLGTKMDELRHSLAVPGDVSLGTVSRRGRGCRRLALAVPFLKAHGAAGPGRGARAGVSGVGGCWTRSCSGGEGAPGSVPSRPQQEGGAGRGLLAPSSPPGGKGTPEAARMGFTGWESRLVLK